MRELELKGEYITLQDALKFTSMASSGGEAKHFILEGTVKVNGETCTMRGKKLRENDVVSFMDEEIKIIR